LAVFKVNLVPEQNKCSNKPEETSVSWFPSVFFHHLLWNRYSGDLVISDTGVYMPDNFHVTPPTNHVIALTEPKALIPVR